MDNESDNIIVLNDENGEEFSFELLDLIYYKGNEYVVLWPLDEDDDEPGEVVILEYTDNGDDESFDSIDDDITQAVFEIFKRNHQDDFNFVD